MAGHLMTEIAQTSTIQKSMLLIDSTRTKVADFSFKSFERFVIEPPCLSIRRYRREINTEMDLQLSVQIHGSLDIFLRLHIIDPNLALKN
jgi:hypothetical protein